MAGGLVKYRHLSRDSSARQALLRGLVTQLVRFEHIQTTYAKAKEAQRLAEKLITLAKRNNEPCRRNAHGILYTPELLMPKLWGELRTRYLNREGGYTRVIRTEPKNEYDQGESAILEFVDGPKDSRFMMVAKTLARDRLLGKPSTAVTLVNVKKVRNFRSEEELEDMVQRFMLMSTQAEAEGEGEGEGASAGSNMPTPGDFQAGELEAAKFAEQQGAAARGIAADMASAASRARR